MGGNLGDRAVAIAAARRALAEQGWQEVAVSRIYETPPWGKTDQPAFYNAVVEGRWGGSALELLRLALRVEDQLGRERLEKWGPRRIDIDILSFGEQVMHTQRLTLPHPYLRERAFVLVPWAEIAAEFVVAPGAQTVEDMLNALPAPERESVTVVG